MSLTSAQRTQLEHRLLEERKRLQQDLSRFTGDEASGDEQDRTGDLSKMPFHPADQGTEMMDIEVDASNATRQSEELAAIDDALERLYAQPDRFGFCDRGQHDIPFARLEIIPWAQTCEAHA
jgi:DnaK suppressor protein